MAVQSSSLEEYHRSQTVSDGLSAAAYLQIVDRLYRIEQQIVETHLQFIHTRHSLKQEIIDIQQSLKHQSTRPQHRINKKIERLATAVQKRNEALLGSPGDCSSESILPPEMLMLRASITRAEYNFFT